MGGGKDQKQANTQLQQQAAYQSQQQKAFDTRNTSDLDASRKRGDELYESLKGGYGSLASGQAGAVAPGGGGGGGYQAPALDPRYKDIESMYKGFMDTGGWEPDVRKAQQGRIDTLTDIGKTGGISPEDQARMRGGGVYEEFSKTGGFSDADMRNVRARGASVIPAMYGRINQEANRGAAIQGGYGPGRSLLAGRMAREQAGAAAGAVRDTELGLKGEINKGRQWGTQGMTSSETGLQDLLTRNKLQGNIAGSDIQGKMMESIMGGRQWGTSGEKGLVDEAQQRAEAQAQAAAASSAAGAANDKWAQEFNARQKLAGLEGLGSLYTSSPEEYMANKDFAMQSAGSYGNQVNQQSVSQKTGNRSAWDTVGNIAGAVAGGMTGIGGFGSLAGAAGKLGKRAGPGVLPGTF
jgi:hypothetical protein